MTEEVFVIYKLVLYAFSSLLLSFYFCLTMHYKFNAKRILMFIGIFLSYFVIQYGDWFLFYQLFCKSIFDMYLRDSHAVYYSFLISNIFFLIAYIIFASIFKRRNFYRTLDIYVVKLQMSFVGFFLIYYLSSVVAYFTSNLIIYTSCFCLISIIIYVCLILFYNRYIKIKDETYDYVNLDWNFYAINSILVYLVFYLLIALMQKESLDHSHDIPLVNKEQLVVFIFSLFTTIFLIRNKINIEETFVAQKSNEKYANMQKQFEFWNEEIENSRKNEEKMNKFKHDLRHHFLLINGLLANKQYDKATKYIEELSLNSEEFTLQRYCNNIYVNSILSAYNKKAKNDNIETFIKVIAPSNIQFDDLELSTLFANLFENAIEACHYINKKQKKYIIINCDHRNSNFIIMVENSCRSNISFKNGLPVSTKVNGGRGTQIVKQIVEKYNGMVDFSQDKNVFRVRIILSAPRS